MLIAHALKHNLFLKNKGKGFPGGSVVKNPPASAGDMGSILDPGRSHMLQSNQAGVPQLLSLYTLEPVPCKRSRCNKSADCN